MYHDPNPTESVPLWQEDLQRGDVVLFRFPIAETDADAEEPKIRPCLVLEIETKNGRRIATLAYGTGALTKANSGYNIIVKRPGSRNAAGLSKPTRFVGARRLTVSLDNSGFEPAAGSASPVIGRLDSPLLERMNDVRARLHAEADIAADRRRERREEELRWRREERGFRERNRALHAASLEQKGQANA